MRHNLSKFITDGFVLQQAARKYIFINFLKNRCISPLGHIISLVHSLSANTPSSPLSDCLCLRFSPAVDYACVTSASTTTTTTVLWPFVRDYPGEPVPEETLTHPPSSSSSNLYQLLPSTTIQVQVLYCKCKLDSYERIRCMTWSRCTHRMFSHRKDWFQWSSASC